MDSEAAQQLMAQIREELDAALKNNIGVPKKIVIEFDPEDLDEDYINFIEQFKTHLKVEDGKIS